MSWDGTSWSVLSSPDPDSGWNTLNGVSCVAASDCFAVGYASASSGPIYPLIEEWERLAVVCQPEQLRDCRDAARWHLVRLV